MNTRLRTHAAFTLASLALATAACSTERPFPERDPGGDASEDRDATPDVRDGSAAHEPDDGGDADLDATPGGPGWTCGLVNPFSREPECKQYTGDGWTEATAAEDCRNGQYNTPGVFGSGLCAVEPLLGTCDIPSYFGLEVRLYLGGSNPDFCTATGRACTTFLDGTFTAAPPCEGAYIPPSSSASSFVFEWPTQSCQPPLDGEPPGQSAGGDVCTWNLISGCTEDGRRYDDYGSCQTVRTNRPYYAVPGRTVGSDDDPRLRDESFVAESNWVRQQVEACACVCCHTDRAPDGPSMWSVDDGPLFIDAMSDTAIAMFAGYVDSSTFGAFDPAANNGFDRLNSALPTTDPARTLAFFEAEFDRRGIDEQWARSIRPIGGPLVEQRAHVPTPCASDVAIASDGRIVWPPDASARYVYVLDADAANPGMPPNLDLPVGTRWRIDVAHTDAPLVPGEVVYGRVPEGARQAFPADGTPPGALTPGEQVYLYILKDIAVPIARCLATVP